jgi:uncharacterized protein YndB with AHSA1/START domain
MSDVRPPMPPVVRSISVPWDVEAAFHRFTADFGAWWPRSTHSIGGERVARITFECALGGRIVEELTDGRRFQWGRVTAWEPPRRVSFTWHPSRDEREAQDVDITFTPLDAGTTVELVSSGWERLGRGARRARRGYAIGWGSVLNVFAGRRSVSIAAFAVLSQVITFALRVTGRLERAIDQAGGRLPPAAPTTVEDSHET